LLQRFVSDRAEPFSRAAFQSLPIFAPRRVFYRFSSIQMVGSPRRQAGLVRAMPKLERHAVSRSSPIFLTDSSHEPAVHGMKGT
jgi:hypothetical protein